MRLICVLLYVFNQSFIIYQFVGKVKVTGFVFKLENINKLLFFPPRASGPTGSAGVGSLHVCQGPAAAALDGHGQHATGTSSTVARTGQGLLTPRPQCLGFDCNFYDSLYLLVPIKINYIYIWEENYVTSNVSS